MFSYTLLSYSNSTDTCCAHRLTENLQRAFKHHGVHSSEVLSVGELQDSVFTQNILLAFKNTAIIIVVSCVGSIITGTMTAYVVQRFNTYFSRTVKTAFLIATLLPNITMQVTVFQIVYKLGLYRSMLAPIILNIGTDIISIYIFIQFLGQISYSLDESAIMDGASYPGYISA